MDDEPEASLVVQTEADIPANPTVSFDGVGDENAAAVTIPETITYNGVEYGQKRPEGSQCKVQNQGAREAAEKVSKAFQEKRTKE